MGAIAKDVSGKPGEPIPDGRHQLLATSTTTAIEQAEFKPTVAQSESGPLGSKAKAWRRRHGHAAWPWEVRGGPGDGGVQVRSSSGVAGKCAGAGH